jgi:hypothetical protein
MRILAYTLSAMAVLFLLFLWLVLWYDDIMPNNPPASLYEKAFSLVCTLAMWPLVVIALILGRDPPVICWPFLWLVSGGCWGFATERLCQGFWRLGARTGNSSAVFRKWTAIQFLIWAVGCALWFYMRASSILRDPADPENYGTYGNNWSFQAFAFVMSRLIPVAFGLVGLLVVERLLISLRKGVQDGT